MHDFCPEALCCRPEDLTRALSIHTRKITDSCRDSDCIEDLRVYLTRESQNALDAAAGVRVRCAELLYTDIDVRPVAFSKNQFFIDLTFYYRILADGSMGTCRPAGLCGLAMFSKRAVLCGECTEVHSFSSDRRGHCADLTNLPTAVVEVLDPIVLSSRVGGCCGQECCGFQLPECVRCAFDDELVFAGEQQRLYVTLGQFSIIRLERDAQLVVPVLDYAIPTKECRDDPGCAEDPCDVFSRIPFPADSFTPTACPSEGCDCCRGS